MSVMKRIDARARNNLKKKNTSNRVDRVSATDLGFDLEELSRDLNNRILQRAANKMATIVGRKAVSNLKKGGSGLTTGRSQFKPRMSRGDWKSPRQTKDGVPYLKGGWYGDTLKNRGADKPSMAHFGGNVSGSGGKRGIVIKTDKKKRGKGAWGIVGPKYSADNSDDGVYGYNYAHMLEYGGTHKAWGKDAKPLPARPFLKPASNSTLQQQANILNADLKKWGEGK